MGSGGNLSPAQTIQLLLLPLSLLLLLLLFLSSSSSSSSSPTTRFLLVLSPEERQDPARVGFQLEKAHWFYLDNCLTRRQAAAGAGGPPPAPRQD